MIRSIRKVLCCPHPKVLLQINPLFLIEFDPLALQKHFLFSISMRFGQTDQPFGIDNPVPGEIVLAAHGVDDPGDLSRSVGLPGHLANASVGADHAFGDAFDDLNNVSGKRLH